MDITQSAHLRVAFFPLARFLDEKSIGLKFTDPKQQRRFPRHLKTKT